MIHNNLHTVYLQPKPTKHLVIVSYIDRYVRKTIQEYNIYSINSFTHNRVKFNLNKSGNIQGINIATHLFLLKTSMQI